LRWFYGFDCGVPALRFLFAISVCVAIFIRHAASGQEKNQPSREYFKAFRSRGPSVEAENPKEEFSDSRSHLDKVNQQIAG
jgi:hypothetical protein